jgi:hypothetical protein
MFDAAATGSDDARGAAVAVAFMGLCTLVYAVTRATAVRRTFVTSRHMVDASLELFQVIARRQRARALAFAAACALAGVAISQLPFGLDGRLLLGVTPALMFVVAIVSALQLHRLLGLRAEPELRVMSHGPFMYAASGELLVGWVAAPPALIARASHLPTARLRVAHATK